MDWTFVYLMVVLKIPIVGLFAIIWWAVKAAPVVEAEKDDGEQADGDGGGGSKRPREPFGPRPRTRGPHGDPTAPAPPRTRSVTARGRRAGEHPQRSVRRLPREPSR